VKNSGHTNFHEDVFYEYFRPFRHREAKFDIWGGLGLETFGEDLDLVGKYDKSFVWTVVDGDKDQWIVPGLHYVNRVCYLLSEVPHNEGEIQFRVSSSVRSLSPLGLRRRISTLRRRLANIAR
jgi:hypothetical protein